MAKTLWLSIICSSTDLGVEEESESISIFSSIMTYCELSYALSFCLSYLLHPSIDIKECKNVPGE